jgi:hypothetical protein
LKITSTQGRLYVPSITSSMNSLSSSSFLDMDRVLFFRHRPLTWTESFSFEQATSQSWCHIETSPVKAGATNVWDNSILPPTASGDDVGERFFSTDCVRWWHRCTLLCSQDTKKSRWSRVGTSKIILDFYPVICLVRWIMDRLGKVGREVVTKLDYQW